MKTVNNICFFVTILILFYSCKENRVIKNEIKNELMYNPDSIFYNIDVEWNKNKTQEELFLVTKLITVKDSSFGGYNDNNWKRAWQFLREKYPKMECPNCTYNICLFENNKFNEFASIIYDGRDITYPILRQGEFSNLNSDDLKGKYKKIPVSNFLRIMEISNDDLDSKSINLIYKNKKWIVISKEILNHNLKIEYGIDTTKNNFSLKKMNIHYLFDYPQSNFNWK